MDNPTEHIETEIRRRELRIVFNSDAPRLVDAQIASLCVLFEDLRIEVMELSKNRPSEEDPAKHRLNYFLRRSIATLQEFGERLIELDKNQQFLPIRRNFGTTAARFWSSAVAHFSKNVGKVGKKRIITAVRDDIGGHFGWEAAEKSIKVLRPGAGEIEIFNNTETNLGGCRLRFAPELALSVLIDHAGAVSFEDWFPTFYEGVVAPAYRHAVEAVNSIVKHYLWERFEA